MLEEYTIDVLNGPTTYGDVGAATKAAAANATITSVNIGRE